MKTRLMNAVNSDDAFTLTAEMILVIAAVAAAVIYVTWKIGTALTNVAGKTTDEIEQWEPGDVFTKPEG